MTTLTYTGKLVVTSCWCGIGLAIPDDLYNEARRTPNRSVYCPLGHTFVYGNTTEEQLTETRRQLASERRRVEATRDLLKHEEHSHRGTKGIVTKLKKRVAAGVCPCCNRTFKDLARHMEGQHPDYVKSGTAVPGSTRRTS